MTERKLFEKRFNITYDEYMSTDYADKSYMIARHVIDGLLEQPQEDTVEQVDNYTFHVKQRLTFELEHHDRLVRIELLKTENYYVAVFDIDDYGYNIIIDGDRDSFTEKLADAFRGYIIELINMFMNIIVN